MEIGPATTGNSSRTSNPVVVLVAGPGDRGVPGFRELQGLDTCHELESAPISFD